MMERSAQEADEGAPIKPCVRQTVACHAYEPVFPAVAMHVAGLIRDRRPAVEVEHVGSTAVEGCAGRGAIDLLVLCKKDEPLEGVQALLRDLEMLGFGWVQPIDLQSDRWPIGGGMVDYAGATYRVHIHVLPHDHPAAAERRAFRDRLRTDARFRAAYVALKEEIVASGLTDAIAYSKAKAAFVHTA
jgi:GrpB-like predicted nucleotidyltransferase (UPF0157 family)